MLPFFAVAAITGNARVDGSMRPPGAGVDAGEGAFPQMFQPAAIAAARTIAANPQGQSRRRWAEARGAPGGGMEAGSGADVVLAVIVSFSWGPVGNDLNCNCPGLSMIRCSVLVTIC